jgi:hypothetical protein
LFNQKLERGLYAGMRGRSSPAERFFALPRENVCRSRLRFHPHTMTAFREIILVMLQRLADGGDITMQELDAAVPGPLALDGDEKEAGKN